MVDPQLERTFCTTRQAAELLGVSIGTVQLWVENGVLDAWKTAGGHRRVQRDSVDRLLRRKPADPGAPVAAVAAVAPAPAQPRALSVVVVEDDPHLLRLYEHQLGRWPMGPQVVAIDNAVNALLLLGRSRPDLLITDLNLPLMDGFAMLRTLCASPEVSRTTIVAVSGLGADEVAARGGVPYGVELLPKPVPFDRLLAIGLRVAQSLPDVRQTRAEA
ncbi:MAG: hypothetical protein RIQ60_3524 [Pseudomonadota bacterium]|jgi:excisionase family DNA binding protein